MKNLLLILFLLLSSFVVAEEGEDDPLALAALLIKNQNYSRANNVLKGIKNPHDVIPEKYWGLVGLLELKQKRFDKAEVAFLNAKKEGLKSIDLYLGLGQAYLGLKEYQKGIAVLSEDSERLKDSILYFQLMASLHFESEKEAIGWDYLEKGIAKFPKSLELAKQKWFYLVENNLVEVSFEQSKEIIDHYELSALDTARMGQRYRQLGEVSKAIFLGEVARLKDQSDEEIIKDLARSYLKNENYTAAAQLFKGLAEFNSDYLVEASELWRKAGYPVMAERIALEIRDPLKKIKQNITLSLLNEDFNRMANLGIEVQRSELKNDQDLQYAIAYANFMLGDFKKVEEHLAFIQRNDLFKKAVALREAIESCESGESLCL